MKSQLKTWLQNRPEYLKRYNRMRKEKVISHYTQGKHQCQCPGCSESLTEFLTIDHIHENGAIHRKANNLAGGVQTIGWLIKKEYPCGFQILCHNCNAAKSYYGHGTCPHVTAMKQKRELYTK